MWLRRLEKFTNRDGDETYTFPRVNYRHESAQQLRAGRFNAAGQDYPVRMLGFGRSLKNEARESVEFLVIDTATRDPAVVNAALDDLRGKLQRFGMGKLWSIDDDSSRRWCWATAGEMPAWATTSQTRIHVMARAVFIRWSDWYAETAETGSVDLGATTVNFDITNPGTARAGMLIIRVRSGAVGGFDGITISNAANGQSVITTREAVGADDEVRIRAANNAVEYSADNGATYADDYALVTVPAGQAVLMELEAGLNPMTYETSGTPSATLEYEYYPAYAS